MQKIKNLAIILKNNKRKTSILDFTLNRYENIKKLLEKFPVYPNNG